MSKLETVGLMAHVVTAAVLSIGRTVPRSRSGPEGQARPASNLLQQVAGCCSTGSVCDPRDGSCCVRSNLMTSRVLPPRLTGAACGVTVQATGPRHKNQFQRSGSFVALEVAAHSPRSCLVSGPATDGDEFVNWSELEFSQNITLAFARAPLGYRDHN